MAQNQKSGGVLDSVRDTVGKNPAAERLFGEVETFVRDRGLDFVDSIGDRIGDLTERLEDFASNGGSLKRAGKAMSEGDGPLKAGLKAVGGGIKDRVGDLIGGGGGGKEDGQKATVIAESIEVGVPVSVAYNQWTQFHEFGKFTKGVQSVNQEDETHTNWKAKIWWSTRSWDATITEQIPDERIAWESDGDKGSVNGVVTFHELAPNLTKVLMELEYHPKGFMEKTGNLWRAQGRRARLDLKHFRRFVMMRGEETGAWRGEVHDGEVTKKSSDGGGRSSRRRAQDDSRRNRRSNGDQRSSGRGRRNRRSREEMRRERRRTRSQRERRDRPDRRQRAENSSTGDDSTSSSSANGGAKKTAARRKRTSSAKKTASSSSGNGSSNGSGNGGAKKTSARRQRTSPAKKTASSSSGNGSGNGAAKKTTARRQRTSPAKKTTSSKSSSAPAKKAASTRKRASSPPRKSTTRKSTSSRKTTSGGKKTAAARKSTAGRKTTSAARKSPSGRKTSTRKTTSKRSTARKRS